jgi:hypothetical protein
MRCRPAALTAGQCHPTAGQCHPAAGQCHPHRGPVPPCRGPVPSHRGPVPPCRGPVPSHRGPVPSHRGPVPSAASCAQPPLTERRRRRGWCRPAALTAGQCHPHRGPVPSHRGPVPSHRGPVPSHRGPVQPLPRAGPCDGRHAERVRARAQSARESLLRRRTGSRPGAERKSRGSFRNARKLPNADRARASRVCERYGRNDAGMRADTAQRPYARTKRVCPLHRAGLRVARTWIESTSQFCARRFRTAPVLDVKSQVRTSPSSSSTMSGSQ